MNLIRYFVTLSVFLFGVIATCAQADTEKKNKVRIVFNFDGRNSLVMEKSAKVYGVRLGIEINKTHRMGLSFYTLTALKDFKKTIIVDKDGNKESIDALIRFSYAGPFYEYLFYNTKRWEFSTAHHIGLGSSRLSIKDTLPSGKTKFRNLAVQPILVYEPTVLLELKIWHEWLGIGTGLGYRYLLMNNSRFNLDLNSAIYIFRFKVKLGNIFRDLVLQKGKARSTLDLKPPIEADW